MKDNDQYFHLCISRPLSLLELIPYSCVRETEGILSTNQETYYRNNQSHSVFNLSLWQPRRRREFLDHPTNIKTFNSQISLNLNFYCQDQRIIRSSNRKSTMLYYSSQNKEQIGIRYQTSLDVTAFLGLWPKML